MLGVAMPSTKTIHEVLKALRKNSDLTNEEKNYVRLLAQKTKYSRQTIYSTILFLEEEGLVTRVRDGNKKIIILNIG